MQRLGKNYIIVGLCTSLFLLFLFQGESKQTNNVTNEEFAVNSSSKLKPLNQGQSQNIEHSIRGELTWTDEQLITRLNHKDPLIILQTLSYLWVHIDDYSKRQKIMVQVSHLAKRSNDRRISGLSSLVSGQLVQRSKSANPIVITNDDWEMMEQENLFRADEQSESDNENQTFSFNNNDSINSENSEDPTQYIDQLLTHKDESNINKLNTLIIDADEEVSVAAADALIDYLSQGIGNQDEIVEILKENITLLDDLQIQAVKEILKTPSTTKQN